MSQVPPNDEQQQQQEQLEQQQVDTTEEQQHVESPSTILTTKSVTTTTSLMMRKRRQTQSNLAPNIDFAKLEIPNDREALVILVKKLVKENEKLKRRIAELQHVDDEENENEEEEENDDHHHHKLKFEQERSHEQEAKKEELAKATKHEEEAEEETVAMTSDMVRVPYHNPQFRASYPFLYRHGHHDDDSSNHHNNSNHEDEELEELLDEDDLSSDTTTSTNVSSTGNPQKSVYKSPEQCFQFVLEKMKKMKISPSQNNTNNNTNNQSHNNMASHVNISKMEQVARMLSNAQLLQSTFLSVDMEGTNQTMNSVMAMYENNESIESKEQISKLQVLSHMMNSTNMDLNSSSISGSSGGGNSGSANKLKIKLVIVEQNQRSHRIAQAFSPVLNVMNIAPRFGTFHSAITIGPWYLDWNNSSLCIPRKCCSRNSVMAMDIGKDLDQMESQKVLSIIAEYIVEWNTQYKYGIRSRNCHRFVMELCLRLGIQLDFSDGIFGRYMKDLQKNGRCGTRIELNEELKQKFNRTHVEFETHKQLDEFMNANSRQLTEEDKMLLKSFDRAFWLRHFANPMHFKFKPCGCPFRNPIHTGSIIQNDRHKSLQFTD